MAGELKQSAKGRAPIRDIDAFEQQAKTELGQVLSFLKAHPTLSISTVYLLMSCIGLAYVVRLFSLFEVDILPHLELTDFVLASMHYPEFFVMSGVILLTIFLMLYLDRQWKKIARVKRFFNIINRPFFSLNPLLTYLSLALMMVAIAIDGSTGKEARDYRKELKQGYRIVLNTPVTQGGRQVAEIARGQILADTTKYLWVYEQASRQIYAIPFKNLATLSPLPPRSDEVAAKTAPDAPALSKAG